MSIIYDDFVEESAPIIVSGGVIPHNQHVVDWLAQHEDCPDPEFFAEVEALYQQYGTEFTTVWED